VFGVGLYNAGKMRIRHVEPRLSIGDNLGSQGLSSQSQLVTMSYALLHFTV